MRHGVRTAKEMVPRPNLGKGIDRQLIVVDLDPIQIGMQRATQIGIQHELLIRHAQQPIQKARRMQDEIRPTMNGGQHRHGAFHHRLGVRQL